MQKSPQLEEGYVRIANELFDAILAFPFTGRQQKVVLAVIRKTYGYGKKEDDMSASQLAKLCAFPRNHVTAELNKLAELNVIHKRPGQYGSIVGLNKNYMSWIDPETKKPLSKVRGERTLDAVNSKKHHYVYRISDAEGRFYIGVRSCDCLPEQDRYMGSGNWLAVVDKRELTKEILSKHATREEAEKAEVAAIKSYDWNGNCMNSRRYVSTDSVHPSTDSVRVQKMLEGETDSVQVDRTDSVHTKDNLPKDNRQKDLSGKPSAASFTADAKAALEYLNTKTGASFRPVDSNLGLVKARLKEGYSLDEVKAVIDLKAAEWGGDPKMQKYLRPKTIFSATNFNQYIGQIPQGGGDWWTRLGFRSAFEAENAGYSKHSAKVHA